MGVVELTTRTWEGYAARWASAHGVDPRLAPQPFRGWFRLSYGLARVPARFGTNPVTITAVGLILSLCVPLIAGLGGSWPLLAAFGVLISVALDDVSRGVAVLTERVTRSGYVYSAVAERIAEVCWLMALWLLGAPAGLVVACGAISWLHEYIRSRVAETGAVLTVVQGIGDVGSRAFVACSGLALCGLIGALSETLARGVAAFVATVWLLFAGLGFARLLSTVRRALG